MVLRGIAQLELDDDAWIERFHVVRREIGSDLEGEAVDACLERGGW
jgi:hypothetical protein